MNCFKSGIQLALFLKRYEDQFWKIMWMKKFDSLDTWFVSQLSSKKSKNQPSKTNHHYSPRHSDRSQIGSTTCIFEQSKHGFNESSAVLFWLGTEWLFSFMYLKSILISQCFEFWRNLNQNDKSTSNIGSQECKSV